MLTLLVIAVLVVAYANGANANFKGVASLFGSGTTSYRTAVNWAAVTTAAGCVAAMFFASSMLKAFSGKGLVPDALIAQPAFLLAVVLGSVLQLGLRPPAKRSRVLDTLHFFSAGAVCFARGLNDTPKMAALLLGIGWLQGSASMILIAIAMALGGLISAKQVAETLAHKITDMNPGQGFAANLATALLVTTASLHGLPVSTTHVSVGALLGIGITTRQAKWRTVIPVLAAWVITLPCSALLAALLFKTISA